MIGQYGIFLDYHIFDIPKGYPPFILIRRPIEGVLSSVLNHEKQPYHLEVRDTHFQCHGPEVKREYVWSMEILETSTLDSQNRLEHEGFTLDGSQIPCSQQKFLELSSPITNDFTKPTTFSFSLCMLTLKGRLYMLLFTRNIANFVVIFGANLAARAMMVSLFRLVAR
jgi:hypothetical protein